jgi:sterol desaturase/sphingolipid hydroxylase (fatty acid hydroxylase superfamily)
VEAVTSGTIYAVGVPIILLMIACEAVVSSWKHYNFYERGDTLGTLGLLAGNIVMAGLTKGAVLVFSLYLYKFRLWDLNALLPAWALWVLTFLAIDLVFYWYHRCSHRVRMLWAIHMNHHCSEEMNFFVAFRQAWFGPVSKIPFFAVLPLLGFDPTITVVAGVAATLWGVVGHTRWINTLGPLEWVLNTPSHHRVHHGSNPEYIDKNYGNLLIIWDRMFGTFAQERAPVVFGLVNNVNTQNPFKITFMVWLAMWRDVRSAASASDALNHVFGPPEWQPSAQRAVGGVVS